MFESRCARVALAARVDKASDAGEIAWLELRDARPDSRDFPDDFVPRHHGIERHAEVVVDEMNVGVADAAVDYVIATSLGPGSRRSKLKGASDAPTDWAAKALVGIMRHSTSPDSTCQGPTSTTGLTQERALDAPYEAIPASAVSAT